MPTKQETFGSVKRMIEPWPEFLGLESKACGELM